MENQNKYYVYVLTLNSNPIYVGMTSNVNERMEAHKYKGKEFNSHIIVETFDNKRDALICERGIIKYLSIFKSDTITNAIYQRLSSYDKYL